MILFFVFLYRINILISEYLFFYIYKKSAKVIREIVCTFKSENNKMLDPTKIFLKMILGGFDPIN